METENRTVTDASKNDQVQTKKDELTDHPSDRESSVDSFHTNKSEFSTATETELIDVDDIELSDEESWLYRSPKKVPSANKSLSTWLHKDIEDSDNLELQSTKNALVRKLSQLQIESDMQEQLSKKVSSQSKTSGLADPLQISNNKPPTTESSESAKKEVGSKETKEDFTNRIESDSTKGKENEILDVSNVHKIAQLQEESLRQSTYKFENFLEKRERMDRSYFHLHGQNLSKPASVEEIYDNKNRKHSLNPVQTLKKQDYVCSSPSLNCQQDSHRGSLPDINPGYYSLRSKKSRKSMDAKMGCPLPMYPSHARYVNGHSSPDAYHNSRRQISPLDDGQECRTLPSSYRVRSKSNSSRKDPGTLTPSPRRESAGFLPNLRHHPSSLRRDSAPIGTVKYVSPLSSPTMYQRGNISPLVLASPTQSRRNPPKDLKTSPGLEHYRAASHSPSRRVPLATMLNRSPKRGNSPASSPRHEERNFKVPPKMQNPGSITKSGIPVPSTFMARANSEDDSWNHDCF